MKDSIGDWDEIGGFDSDATPTPGWNVLRVTCGQEIANPSLFKVAIFGAPITPTQLDNPFKEKS